MVLCRVQELPWDICIQPQDTAQRRLHLLVACVRQSCAPYMNILHSMHNLWHISLNVFIWKKQRAALHTECDVNGMEIHWLWAKNVSPHLFVCWTLLQRYYCFSLTTSIIPLLSSTHPLQCSSTLLHIQDTLQLFPVVLLISHWPFSTSMSNSMDQFQSHMSKNSLFLWNNYWSQR